MSEAYIANSLQDPSLNVIDATAVDHMINTSSGIEATST